MGGSRESLWQKIMLYGLEFIGRYYGSYRAFVVDNQDEDRLGRLKLRIPHLNANIDDDTWAFPSGVWGGKDYGIQMLPEIGDMVWVEYEYGNADYPVWKHAGYALDELPEEFSTVSHYGFKTPKGSLILINDNKDEENILVKLNSKTDWVDIKKDIFEIESKIIKLGKQGEQPAVMGDTIKEHLDEIMVEIDKTQQAILDHIHTTPNGPSGKPINSPTFQTIKDKLKTIKNKFPEFLSEKVKLDKRWQQD